MNPTRHLLLWLSRRPRLGELLQRSPLRERLVSRFVAGRSAQEAVERARPLLAQGFGLSFSHLGEDVGSAAEAEAATAAYRELAAAIAGAGMGSSSVIAVKPTLIGLELDAALAARCLGEIAEAAVAAGARVELDMERSALVERTLALLQAGRRHDPEMGIAIQAYLHRSAGDVEALIGEGSARVRVVKGAYAEPASVAMSGAAVRRSYHELVRRLMSAEAVALDARVAVATHDEALIASARTRAFRGRVPEEVWEVQMLLGVRPLVQQRLLAEGYAVRVYLPYGTHWYPYFMRRLAERPANLWFALRHILSG